MSGALLRVAAAVLFALALAGLFLSEPGQRFERNAGLWALYALRGNVSVPPEAIVIALDQKSTDWLAFHSGNFAHVSDSLPRCLPETTRSALERLRNVSDMPRGIHACLLDELGRRGARLVVFDILFSIETPDDEALAAAIRSAPPVVLFERIRDAVEQGVGRGTIVPPQRVRPRPIFAQAAAATSSFLVSAPSGNFVEGYVRHHLNFPELAALPETAAALYRGATATAPDGTGPAIRPIWLYGPPRTIPTWSLRDIFDRSSPRPLPDDLSRTAVFIGVSDPDFLGSKDHFKIPISDQRANDIGGVELGATAFLNILHGDVMRRPDRSVAAAIVFATLLTGALAAQFVGGWKGLGVVLGLGTLYGAGAFALFLGARIWPPFATPLFAGLPLLVTWALLARYAFARRMVTRLAPRQMAAQLLDRTEAASRALRTEAATVLYTDLVGSTELGDRLSPEAYSDVINHYYQRATEAVEAEGGMIVEFMGDGILAVFTESFTGRAHAAAGCAAARRLSQVMRESAEGSDAPPGGPQRLRMGIHTGIASTGGMGAAHRFNFKVLGDTVNTAARLEQLGKAFDDGVRDVILLSDPARVSSNLPDQVVECLGEFALRGKRDAMQIFRLLDQSTSPRIAS
ncbi:adenylate/guanylate cyclase domain-containing protein [Limibaculum sp. M0105]|uniref:Adenylate/guanylate cyclase domain-containing protein n=1 Tax=Thermohalobaculum xanthum TaxID=2753746 RepID=A0A8J7M7T9_9RHOB|nr:adenylate/guanylate cyclase domain-containing protein [Thermohalobaculum xanthum]MBK0399144.1 adenylate/guanylate cyclase domain-containing protein [Thermohalobaculum xanthum]